MELVARHVVFQLSLDEFANVDLDAMTEEQDPPSFKAARKRDRDRLLQVRSIKSIRSNNLSILKYHCNQPYQGNSFLFRSFQQLHHFCLL